MAALWLGSEHLGAAVQKVACGGVHAVKEGVFVSGLNRSCIAVNTSCGRPLCCDRDSCGAHVAYLPAKAVWLDAEAADNVARKHPVAFGQQVYQVLPVLLNFRGCGRCAVGNADAFVHEVVQKENPILDLLGFDRAAVLSELDGVVPEIGFQVDLEVSIFLSIGEAFDRCGCFEFRVTKFPYHRAAVAVVVCPSASRHEAVNFGFIFGVARADRADFIHGHFVSIEVDMEAAGFVCAGPCGLECICNSDRLIESILTNQDWADHFVAILDAAVTHNLPMIRMIGVVVSFNFYPDANGLDCLVALSHADVADFQFDSKLSAVHLKTLSNQGVEPFRAACVSIRSVRRGYQVYNAQKFIFFFTNKNTCE